LVVVVKLPVPGITNTPVLVIFPPDTMFKFAPKVNAGSAIGFALVKLKLVMLPVAAAKVGKLAMLLFALFKLIEPVLLTVKLEAPVTLSGPEFVIAVAVALVVTTVNVPLIVEAPRLMLDAVPIKFTFPLGPTVAKLIVPP